MHFYSKKAKQFLDLNWKERVFRDRDLNHKELAALIGFSAYRYSLKMCKRNFNLTVEKFLVRCRVAEVKQFMSQPISRNFTLLEIAHKFGYPHRRTFNRNFISVEGITQREFWFFLDHFKKTTGMELVQYQRPELNHYIPHNNKPTFLSNFLNNQLQQVYNRQKIINK